MQFCTRISPSVGEEKTKQQQKYTCSRLIICCGFTTAKDDNNFTGEAIARLLCTNTLPYLPQPLLLLPEDSHSTVSGLCLETKPAKSLPSRAWLPADTFRPRWTFNANQSSALDTELPLLFQALTPNLHWARLSSLREHSLPSKFLYHCSRG